MTDETQRLRDALVEIRDLANVSPLRAMQRVSDLASAALAEPAAAAPDTRPRLTDRQAAFLSTINDLIQKRGYPPSFREVQEAMGFAGPSGVVCHAKALAKKGYLRWDAETARSFVVIGASS